MLSLLYCHANLLLTTYFLFLNREWWPLGAAETRTHCWCLKVCHPLRLAWLPWLHALMTSLLLTNVNHDRREVAEKFKEFGEKKHLKKHGDKEVNLCSTKTLRFYITLNNFLSLNSSFFLLSTFSGCVWSMLPSPCSCYPSRTSLATSRMSPSTRRSWVWWVSQCCVVSLHNRVSAHLVQAVCDYRTFSEMYVHIGITYATTHYTHTLHTHTHPPTHTTPHTTPHPHTHHTTPHTHTTPPPTHTPTHTPHTVLSPPEHGGHIAESLPAGWR